MLQINSERIEFATKLQNIIDKYNAGNSTNEEFFEELLAYKESLTEEQNRAAREGLTEEELEIYDLLKQDRMTREETTRVKLAAKELLENIKSVLVNQWYKDESKRKKVFLSIGDLLDIYLPESYDIEIFSKKKEGIYNSYLKKAINGKYRIGA